MGHRILEAIIENGQIKRTNKKLPNGRIKVHIIYDTEKENANENNVERILTDTSGLYKSVNEVQESKKLRNSWERNAGN